MEILDSLNRRLRAFLSQRALPDWAIRGIDFAHYSTGLANRFPMADQEQCLSSQPLLIIGAGRSGTTLLRSMLAAGGEIAIPPESQVLGTVARRFRSLQFLGWDDLCRLVIATFESHALFPLWEVNLQPAYARAINLAARERSLARVIDLVFGLYAAEHFPEAERWGDKSPVNTLHLPRVFSTFPEALYLHVIRDGRDAICSMRALQPDIALATRRWKSSAEAVLALQPRLPAGQYCEIRYEDLVHEPEATLTEVCHFVGIPYSRKMLDFWKLPSTLEHSHFDHHGNLAKPVFSSSVGSWRERLSPDELRHVEAKTSHLLTRFGYLDSSRDGRGSGDRHR